MTQENQSPFEQIKKKDSQGNEYWEARELMEKLGYKSWQRFNDAIERAKISCSIAHRNISEHFINVDKTSEMPKGGNRHIEDYELTKYACHIIAMNGDVRKQEIANAQAYFSVQVEYAETIQSKQIPEIAKSRQEIARELAIAYNDLADALDQMERQEEQLKLQAPKVKIYDEFFDSSLLLDGSQIARILQPKLGLNRNKLYERFVNEGILMRRKSQSGGLTVTSSFMGTHPNFIRIVPEKIPNGKTALVPYFYPAFLEWYIQKHKLV